MINLWVATFPGVSPQPNTEFRVFKRKQSTFNAESSTEKRITLAQSHRILRGNNETIEYHGDTTGDLSQSLPCRYAVGVYDKRTKKLVFREANLAHCEQTIKAVQTALADSNIESRIVSLHPVLF